MKIPGLTSNTENSVEESSYAANPAGTDSEERKEIVNKEIKESLGDSLLGWGQMVSKALSSVLPQVIAPRVIQLAAGASRMLGGIGMLATSGVRILDTFRQERAENSSDYAKTRREVVLSAASASAGFAAGSVAGLAVAAAAFVGLPAGLVGAVGVAGALGVGYATFWVRDELAKLI